MVPRRPRDGHERKAADAHAARAEFVECGTGDRTQDDADRRGGQHDHAGDGGGLAEHILDEDRQRHVGCGDCGVDQSDQNRGVAEVAGGKGVNAQQWLIELDLLVYECDEGHKTNDD